MLEGVTGQDFRQTDGHELPHFAGEQLRVGQVELVALHGRSLVSWSVS